MENTNRTFSDEEIISSIKKGITDAKGSEDAINLITEEDCLKLGEELANRKIFRKAEFFSIVVHPINNVEEAKESGWHKWFYSHITEKTVSLQQATGSKQIYYVPVKKRVKKGEEAAYLAGYGKKPVSQSPNYLLGMSSLVKDILPEEMNLKKIVAFSTDRKEIFSDHDENHCLLYCDIGKNGEHELAMVRLPFLNYWYPSQGWYFLAEDL